MVHGVPERAEPPSAHEWSSAPRRRLRAVLFDFHGTLAQVEDPVDWVVAAAKACGASLDRLRATVLADRLVMAGRAGGPVPTRIPPHLLETWAERDLYPHAHRAAYTGLAASVDAGIEGLAEALYERLLRAEGWALYADTLPTLRALRAAAVPVAVISNIGFDIRPIAADLGFAPLVDRFVLSYEVGRCKPDPAIFMTACAALRVEPEAVLMVGDTPGDAGAVALGCTALVVPAGAPGTVNGLAGALDLLGDPGRRS
jgi:HAD superfamily hydrolase (TIGR01509 family)